MAIKAIVVRHGDAYPCVPTESKPVDLEKLKRMRTAERFREVASQIAAEIIREIEENQE